MKNIINQLFEIEKKANDQGLEIFERNFTRVYHELEEMGYRVVNPIGQKYDVNDTALEANVTHAGASKITKVLKPVIYRMENGNFSLEQRGVVIVE